MREDLVSDVPSAIGAPSSCAPSPIHNPIPYPSTLQPCREWLQEGKTLHDLAAAWRPRLPAGLALIQGQGEAAPQGGADPEHQALLRAWTVVELVNAMRDAYHSVRESNLYGAPHAWSEQPLMQYLRPIPRSTREFGNRLCQRPPGSWRKTKCAPVPNQKENLGNRPSFLATLHPKVRWSMWVAWTARWPVFPALSP